MSFSTATLTGKYYLYDNVTPAQGTVEIIPNSRVLIDAESNVILSGRVKVKLGHAAEEGEPGADADGWVHDGSFSVTLPSTDDTTVEPATGRQYAVSAKLKHTGLKAVTGIELAANETVDMAAVTPAAEAAAAFSVFLTAEEYAADMARVAALESAPAATKASLGLGSVDNTSDAAKPVSALQQTALDAKLATTAADSTMAAKVNDPASATRVALSATYAPRPGRPDMAGKIAGLRWLDRWVADAFDPPPAADVPVITYDAAQYGTLVAPTRVGGGASAALDMAGDTHFRYSGFPSAIATPADPTQFVQTDLKPGGASQAAYWPMTVEFHTTSDVIQLKTRAAQVNPNQGIILVNGRMVSQTAITTTTAAGSWTRMRLTFPSMAPRRIQIIAFNPPNGAFGGVGVTTGHAVTRPTNVVNRRIAIIGDSLVNGSGTVPDGATQPETSALRLAYLLGADEVILAGIGGTGWVQQAGGETVSRFGDRVPDVLAMSPHVVVFMGSRNDPSPAGVQAAVQSSLAACSAVPEVYVAGTVTALTSVNAAVKAGTLAAGRPFVDLAGIISGTGKSSAKTNDGNSDYYIGADGIHPTHEGHKFIARRFFEGIAQAFGMPG